MRALLIAAFFLAAACSAPDEAAPAAQAEEPAPGQSEGSEDDLAARGSAAGLSPAQVEQVAGHQFGAVVPRLPEGWRLSAYRDETVAEAVTYPGYSLQYAHEDGRCFELMAASEGLGDVFVIEPPELEEADAPNLALFGPVPIGWSGPDEAGDWGPSRLSTEWFGADGLFFKLSSATEEGCTMIGPETAEELLAGMRYLDPEDDDSLPGHWELVDVFAGEAPGTGPAADAEAHALATFGAAEEEGTTNSVSVLRSGPHIRVILVTSENLADDSVRDQRTRVTYIRDMDEGWVSQYAGRQVRCRDGRGHEDWGPDPCV